MKLVSANNKKITLYSSIDELPIVNFQKYNKYLLIDSGIGSDANDIDDHIVRVAKFIKLGDSSNALKELQNMRQNLHMVNNEISPRHMAFAALIHSIDGKEVDDLSDENLQSIIKDLNKVRRSSLLDLLFRLKKKLDAELELYFPNKGNAKEKSAYDKLKQRTLLAIDKMLKNADVQSQIDLIDDELFKLYSPKSFVGEQSAEIQHDKAFESACLLIAQKSGLDAKKMTTLQFYSALENIKKQLDAEAKAYKKLK